VTTLAVIPARLGATRLPNKPLRLLGGRPLVVRVWERVAAFSEIDRCVVATDSPEVAAVGRAAGAECVLTRADHPSGTDRTAEVVRRPEYSGYDVVVNVQGDEPFVSAAVVGSASAIVRSGRFSLGTVAVPASESSLGDPNVVKVVTADDGRALYFSRAPIPFLREPTHPEESDERRALVRQHVGVYAYSPAALAAWVALPAHPLERVERLEQLRPLAAGLAMGVAVIDEPPAAGVDTEDDLTRANARWTRTLQELA
jgi:3-deoxy-manno-octulosonate cytidylyltransferase (CMP-KDO synthetase)